MDSNNNEPSILDDRRIALLNFLLLNNKIPLNADFNIRDLIAAIPPDQYKKLFENNPEFEAIWKNVDMSQSLSKFLLEHDLAQKHGDNLRLTAERGSDLKRQGSYGKLLEDERFISSEARRITEMELEADRMFHRQFKMNVLIAIGTGMAALYYLLEILNGFFGFYKYPH